MMRDRRSPGRRLGSDEGGLSNVLGAVLLFGILVVMLVTMQTEFVPVWDEEREEAHMDRVTSQLAQAKSDLDRQVDNRTDVPITSPLDLTRSAGFRFFGGTPSPGELRFEQSPTGAAGFRVSSPRMTVFEQNGRQYYGLAAPDDWIALDNIDDTLSGVTNIRALRIRVDLNAPWDYVDGDSATLTLTDADGFAGKAVVEFTEIGGSERALITRIYNDADQEVSSDTESFFHNTDLGYFYIDVLDENLLFAAVVATADPPLTLTLTDDGLENTRYVIVYDSVGAGGGTVTVGTTGVTFTPYDPDPYPSGAITFSASNGRFVDQDYVLEHGAVLRVQQGAAAIVVAPQFRAIGGQVTLVEWTLPGMQGGDHAVVGPKEASIVADPAGSHLSLRGVSPQLTFTVPTEYPAAWWSFLDRQMRLAGLSSTNGDYTLTQGTDSVTLLVEGAETDPLVDDLLLVFRQADIAIDLRASG